jgi:putative acetyltransferase
MISDVIGFGPPRVIRPMVARVSQDQAVSELVIGPDRPDAPDVAALIGRHRAFALAHSPAEEVFALDTDGLASADITCFSAHLDGVLVAVGALRELDARHGEIKSMHTAEAARGGGAGRAVLRHLLAEARRRGYRRVSLETGSMEAFLPARSLYASEGFELCAPFADYQASPNSVCMTRTLEPPDQSK